MNRNIQFYTRIFHFLFVCFQNISCMHHCRVIEVRCSRSNRPISIVMATTTATHISTIITAITQCQRWTIAVRMRQRSKQLTRRPTSMQTKNTASSWVNYTYIFQQMHIDTFSCYNLNLNPNFKLNCRRTKRSIECISEKWWIEAECPAEVVSKQDCWLSKYRYNKF